MRRTQQAWRGPLRAGLFAATILALAWAPAAGAGKGGGKPGGGGPGDGGAPNPAVAASYQYIDGALLLMDIGGENQHTTVPVAMHPSWSPDGGQLVYVGADDTTGDWGVYTADVDGSNESYVTSIIAPWAPHPRWSPVLAPDGEYKILFGDDRDATDANDAIHVVNVDGTERQMLTDLPADGSSAAFATWSPDGTRIAYRLAAFPVYSIRLMTLGVDANGGLQVLADEELDLTGTPLEGRRPYGLAFARTSNTLSVLVKQGPNDYYDIWLVDVDYPADQFNLTDSPDVHERSVSWCAGDAQLVFSAQNRRAVSVHRMDPDGSNVVDIGKAKKGQHFAACKF